MNKKIYVIKPSNDFAKPSTKYQRNKVHNLLIISILKKARTEKY